MGFNIAGMIIDKNFDKDIQHLGRALKWGIEVIEEINYEKAASNWTPDGEFNIYFSETATLIYFPHEWAINKYHVVGTNSLCYAYSATAMTFIVSYMDEDMNHRFFMESDGERMLEEGSPLEWEKDHPTADGLIFKLFDVLLDDQFHQIDMGDVAYRCKRVSFV